MRFYRDELERIRYELQVLREKCTEELATCPEGTLGSSTSSNKYVRFFQSINIGGAISRKTITRNPEMIRKLARKEFLRRLVAELDGNIKAIEKAVRDFRDCDPAVILGSMRKAYQKLNEDYFFGEAGGGGAEHWLMTEDEILRARLESHRDWAEADYLQSGRYPEHKTIMTMSGLMVRSKVEGMIVDVLHMMGVPFRYEQILEVEGYELAPDFTFEDARKMPFFWEHNGMMDDPKYRENFFWKRDIYERNGINEWTNLINTFSQSNDVDMRLIKSVIDTQIIPRL